MNANNGIATERNISILTSLGLRPKYKAFRYVLFLADTYSAGEILPMSDRAILRIVSDKFGITEKMAVSNMHTLIEASIYSTGTTSPVKDQVLSLRLCGLPTVKEFVVIVLCLANERRLSVGNSAVDYRINNFR